MIQLDFVTSLQHTDIVKGLPFHELLGRTNNNYCDGNENVKKVAGLISKAISLQVHHNF